MCVCVLCVCVCVCVFSTNVYDMRSSGYICLTLFSLAFIILSKKERERRGRQSGKGANGGKERGGN